MFRERETERYALHTRHLNEQMVRVLKTIGYDVGFRSGRGQYLYDRDGERYLDLLSGFGVFAIGRNHPVVRDALKAVLDSDFPNLVQMDVSALAGMLAERLLRYVPYLDKVFFANSGTEAVEAALKFARSATGRPGIVYCGHAFHGLSYGALSLNGDGIFREGFGPLLPDCVEVPFNDLAALDKALASRRVAAFVFEPIQGKGVNLPEDGYLSGAQELCRKYGTLFVADEIQTGIGRTGRFLAVEHWGIEPDMVLLAKSLSGGHVPVGAVLTRKWVFDKVFSRMDRAVVHGSTFAKNDLAMAAGLATLDVIEQERLIENAAKMGDRLLSAFEDMARRYELVKDGARQRPHDRRRIRRAPLDQAEDGLERARDGEQRLVLPADNHSAVQGAQDPLPGRRTWHSHREAAAAVGHLGRGLPMDRDGVRRGDCRCASRSRRDLVTRQDAGRSRHPGARERLEGRLKHDSQPDIGVGRPRGLAVSAVRPRRLLARSRAATMRDSAAEPQAWPSVVAVVPARNEAEVIAESLGSLLSQNYPGPFAVILVDDQSTDGTADIARASASPRQSERLAIVSGQAAAAGMGRQALGDEAGRGPGRSHG